VTVQLSTDNVAELPYLNGLSTNLNDGYFLESRLHVIEKDEYPGWEFPKYRSTDNQPIADWWDKSKLLETFNVPELSFPNQRIVDVPVAGMYRMSYRYWPENVGNPPAQLSNCFYIKTYNKQYPVDSSPLRTINNTASNPSYPYAHFSSVFTAGVKSCLLFSGKMGVSGRWGYSQWHWQYPQYSILGLRQYNGFIITASTNQTTINVFGGLDNIINGKDIRDTGYFGRFSDVFTPLPSHLRYGSNYILLSHLVLEVQFRGKWFNSQTEDWQDTRAFIRPELETPMSQEDIVSQIKDHYPPFEVPLYEDLGRGYAMPFGKRQDGTGTDNSGTGTLDIKLYFVNKLGDNFVPFTFWLQDFNFNLVDLADSVQLKSAPKSVQYQYGNKTKPARQKITNYLMSEYDDIVSFSQVYTDNENTKLDTLSYILPVFAGLGVTSTFNVTEKPEYHTLRTIKELISSQVIISDIIPFKDFQSKRLVYYKNNLLVRDGYNIDALNDIVNVNYIIRKQNYTYIMVTIHTTPVNAVPRSATYQYFNSAGGYTIRQSQSQQSDNNVQVIVDDVLPEPGAEQKQIIYVQPSENVEKIWDGSQFKTVSTNTKIVAGKNISISPTTGLGDVTVTAADPPVTKIVAGSNVTISPSAGTGDVTINSADPGVTKITAGSNVTISPTGGTGNVTITATSPGVTSIVAGDYITISPTTGTGAVTVSVNLDTLKSALGL
jgi:hypothetical protein